MKTTEHVKNLLKLFHDEKNIIFFNGNTVIGILIKGMKQKIRDMPITK